MYQYHCLNPIAEVGLDLFTEDYQKTEELNDAQAVLVPVAYNLVKNMSGNSDTESFFWMLPGLLIVVIIFNFCCNCVIHKRVNQYSVRKMCRSGNRGL